MERRDGGRQFDEKAIRNGQRQWANEPDRERANLRVALYE
jgi:hypothetical protein